MKQIYIDSVFKLHGLEPEVNIATLDDAMNILCSTGNFKYLLFDDSEDIDVTLNSINQKIDDLPDNAIVDIELLDSYRGSWQDAKIHYKNGKCSFAAIETTHQEDTVLTFYESRDVISKVLNTNNKKHSLGMYASLNELAIKILIERYYDKAFNNPTEKEIIFSIYTLDEDVVILYGKDIKSQLTHKILQKTIKDKKVVEVNRLIAFCSNTDDNNIFGEWHRNNSPDIITINSNQDITNLTTTGQEIILER